MGRFLSVMGSSDRCSRTETCTSAAVICENLDYEFQILSPETLQSKILDNFWCNDITSVTSKNSQNLICHTKIWWCCNAMFGEVQGMFDSNKLLSRCFPFSPVPNLKKITILDLPVYVSCGKLTRKWEDHQESQDVSLCGTQKSLENEGKWRGNTQKYKDNPSRENLGLSR